MEVGKTKSVTVASDDAYGAHHADRTQAVPRAAVPDHIPLEPGTRLHFRTPEGEQIEVTIAEVTEETVVLDANHPLAGEDLTFAVELVEIV